MTRPRSHDERIEQEVSEMLDRGEVDRAWIRIGYIRSASIRRVWYARVKGAIGRTRKDHDDTP